MKRGLSERRPTYIVAPYDHIRKLSGKFLEFAALCLFGWKRVPLIRAYRHNWAFCLSEHTLNDTFCRVHCVGGGATRAQNNQVRFSALCERNDMLADVARRHEVLHIAPLVG